MSEETNETLSNDEAMDISETGTSDSSETTPEEIAKTHVAMSGSEFEAKLTDFFNKHQKSKLRLVPRIVKEFQGNEDTVLEHLHNKYILGVSPEKGNKKTVQKKVASGGQGHGDSHKKESETETKPKSKKKLVIIIVILVVVLGGGGAAAFLFKDKLFGGGHGAAAGEHGETKAAEHGEHGAAEKPKEEAVTPPATTESTAAATDSAKREQPAAGAEEHGGGH